jgi:hypothetical protein
MGHGALSWQNVVDSPELGARVQDRPALLGALMADFNSAPTAATAALPLPTRVLALMKRLLMLCPCLFNQLHIQATAEATVHFCEIALGAPITCANVFDAFLVQHPNVTSPSYTIPPAKPCTNVGKISEMLCSEVLHNAGVQRMPLKIDKWPDWQMPGHILLNKGKMATLKALGDILIPCAPTNLIISVKTQAARERLLYSSNSIEGIGFGFFNEPEEFWTTSRMQLFKRMGFSAIYLPETTQTAIEARLAIERTESLNVNINGTKLYRPMTQFSADVLRVIGRSSFCSSQSPVWI